MDLSHCWAAGTSDPHHYDAVSLLQAEAGRGQTLADFARDENAAVMPSRAAERNREIALALGDVMRDQVNQEVRDTLDELLGLRKRTDVARHAGMLAAVILERRNVIRIR